MVPLKDSLGFFWQVTNDWIRIWKQPQIPKQLMAPLECHRIMFIFPSRFWSNFPSLSKRPLVVAPRPSLFIGKPWTRHVLLAFRGTAAHLPQWCQQEGHLIRSLSMQALGSSQLLSVWQLWWWSPTWYRFNIGRSFQEQSFHAPPASCRSTSRAAKRSSLCPLTSSDFQSEQFEPLKSEY